LAACSRMLKMGSGSPATAELPGKSPLPYTMLPIVAVPQTSHTQQPQAGRQGQESCGATEALILGACMGIRVMAPP
jgi:hypothetical protein